MGFFKKKKVGDKFKFPDNDFEFEITSKRGAAAFNKNKPKTFKEFKKFIRVKSTKKHRGLKSILDDPLGGV